MNELFSNDIRVLNDRELIYEVTNSREMANVQEYTLEDIFSNLTPGRKRVALAAIELYKRNKEKERTVIISSKDTLTIIGRYLTDLPHEEVWCIFLNQANRVIKKERLSVGGQTQAVVDVRIIGKKAIVYCATAVIMVHNHPSGNDKPSMQDDLITDRTRKALELLDIKLLDHLIVADKSYYSYSDEGRI